MNVSLKQEFVITAGKQVLVLTRTEALGLRDMLVKEFAGEVAPAVPAPAAREIEPIPHVEKAAVPVINGHSTPRTGLAGMHNGDAIEHILKEAGRDMGNKEIFAVLQGAGHRTTKSGMSATLTVDPRFVNIRYGVWGLKNGSAPEPPSPSATLLTEIEDIMGSEPWTLESLANFFARTPEEIKSAMMFPGTRFEQVEEGVMQLKPQYRV